MAGARPFVDRVGEEICGLSQHPGSLRRVLRCAHNGFTPERHRMAMTGLDLSALARIVLAVPFLLSGTIHLVRGRQYLLSILEYRILPVRVARVFARISPLVGISAGALVVAPPFSMWAAITILILTGSFFFAVTINLARGRRFACSCFGGVTDESIGPGTLLRLLVLASFTAPLLWRWTPSRSLSSSDEVGTALVAGALLLAGYVLAHLHLVRPLFESRHRHDSDQRAFASDVRTTGGE